MSYSVNGVILLTKITPFIVPSPIQIREININRKFLLWISSTSDNVASIINELYIKTIGFVNIYTNPCSIPLACLANVSINKLSTTAKMAIFAKYLK
jgi:hypothetical protein